MSRLTDFFNKFKRKRLVEENPVVESQQIPQYQYKDIIEYMENTGAMQEFFGEMAKIVREQDKYFPSKVHGIEHTYRVTFFASIIAKLDNLSEHDKRLLMAAARYHDVGRIDDRETKEHGGYGVSKIEEQNLLQGYSKKDRKIIEFAIEQHSLSREQNEQALKKIPYWNREKYASILSYLKDADALDRVRIANRDMQLDTRRLRHDTSKHLVDFAHSNYREFHNLISKYNLQAYMNMSPDFANAYLLIRDQVFDINWIIDNRNLLIDLYRRNVLTDSRFKGMSILDILEDEKLMYAAGQIGANDFETLRQQGYNITYESFLEIVSSYKEGTLDKLRANGELGSIFSYETFQKYGKKKSFEERLDPNYLSDDQLFDKINEKAEVTLLRSTFNNQYMLYRNLCDNHREAFDMLIYCDALDSSLRHVVGSLEVIDTNDLNILRDKGYNFSLIDLIYLSAEHTPEKYREIIDSGNVDELFAYNPDRDFNGEEYYRYLAILKEKNPEVSENEFRDNYLLYKTILRTNIDVYSVDEIKRYSIQDIYTAYRRYEEAAYRLQCLSGESLEFTPQNLLELLKFLNRTPEVNNLDFKEQDVVVTTVLKDMSLKSDPRFIEYITKKNKVFIPDSSENVVNYNNFCINQIIEKSDISLEEAKSSLLNSLINFECPEGKYKQEVEENLVDELYYYMKYKSEGKFGDLDSRTDAEKEIDSIIQKLIRIMDSLTIDEFKEQLSDLTFAERSVSFDSIIHIVQSQMSDLSKKDIVRKLQETGTLIDGLQVYYIEYEGQMIPVKYLDGQEFALDCSTAMPFCSYMSRKFNYDEMAITENIFNRPLNKNNRCTSLLSHKMFAHSKSVKPKLEVRYGYIPNSPDNIGLVGNRDLSTVKRDVSGIQRRVTSRATQNRTFEDITNTTIEEHNEMVLNNVYPNYILGFDEITDIAVKRYMALKELYAREGINQDIEIVIVRGRDKYLPMVEQELDNNINSIIDEINATGTISIETFNRFFNKRERNLTLQTVQAINSSGYRDSLWSDYENYKKLSNLTTILEKVAEVVPRECLGHVMSQVDFLLDRTEDSASIQKDRFYDHRYTGSLDVDKLKEIKKNIESRISGTIAVERGKGALESEIQMDEK